MSIPLSKDTEHALGRNAVLNENRSFLLHRRQTLPCSRQEQGGMMDRILQLKPVSCWNDAWRQFLTVDLDLAPDQVLFARLMSRLSLHLWTDSADPGSLLLDRLSNRPVLPGCAVKGCARQMALELLHATAQPEAKARLLADIALVFGWSMRDWTLPQGADISGQSPQKNAPGTLPALLSDSDRPGIVSRAQEIIWQQIFPREPYSTIRWRQRLPRRVGQAVFLPAYTWEPAQADLALEVITPHHPQYYRGDPAYDQAPDNERTIPQLFPVIASDQVFAFAIPGTNHIQELAREWLRQGLACIGLGARKSSGYGWFDTSDILQSHYRDDFARVQRLLRRAVQDQAEDEWMTDAHKSRPSTSEPIVEPDASRPPAQEPDLHEPAIKASQFWGKLQNFRSLPIDEKVAIVGLLQGSQSHFWEEIKQRASRGGQWAQVDQAIRTISREHDLGKMS